MARQISDLNEKLNSIEKTMKEFIAMPVAYSEEDILTLKDAAKLLRISIKTLYNRTSVKSIPHRKDGKFLIFSKSVLQEYLKSKEIL